VDASTINELTHRPELKHVLEEDRRSKEDSLVDELLAGLAKEKVVYGIKDVKKSADEGAIKALLVAEEFLRHSRVHKSFKIIEDIMKSVDRSKGTVHIISTDDAGRKIMGLGGIAGFLRWS
jgi:stalled ribosome rescue protein Dom34